MSGWISKSPGRRKMRGPPLGCDGAFVPNAVVACVPLDRLIFILAIATLGWRWRSAVILYGLARTFDYTGLRKGTRKDHPDNRDYAFGVSGCWGVFDLQRAS